MTCYVGSAQLGGTAFCTKRCDPNRPAEPGFFCTSSGALLESCHPGAEDIPCQSPLGCYRTDLIRDDGVCLWVPTCEYGGEKATHDDRKCGISRSICAGAVLQTLVSGSALESFIHTDNLHCVAEPPCDTNGCPGTGLPEACPSDFYQIDFDLPITCGSVCDRFACPPNFACARSSNSGSPSLCLPGVLGMRCSHDEDCLVGDCLDTGAGFGECALPGGCQTHEDCLRLEMTPAFACIEGVDGDDPFCVSAIPFQGSNCEDSSQCAEDLRCGDGACPPQKCSWYSPFELDPAHGECRFSCDGECPAFGGLPHACIDGACYPAMVGVPCSESSDCFEKLTCGAVPPDERSASSAPMICTVPCSDDTECTSMVNPWIADGYCVAVSDPPPAAKGYCRLGGRPGRPCEKDEHCASRSCGPTEEGLNRCRE